MLYTSDRNFGCRFNEIFLHGRRSIVMENQLIRITVVLDKGTEIVEFNIKKTDTDIIWRAPQGLSSLSRVMHHDNDEQYLMDDYTGGWFELFPSTGGRGEYLGADIPFYGEVRYLPWEYSVVNDDPEQISIRCFVKTVKMPFYVEKIFTLNANDPTLYIKETAVNLSRMTLKYQWGHHINIGSNFIDDSCRIELDGRDYKVVYSPGEKRLKNSVEGIWPRYENSRGDVTDLSRVTGSGSDFCDVVDVYDIGDARAAIVSAKRRQKLIFSWDGETFRHCSVWQVSNGETMYPRYGETYVVGFIPFSDRSRGLSSASGNADCPVIEPYAKKSTWLNLCVEDF